MKRQLKGEHQLKGRKPSGFPYPESTRHRSNALDLWEDWPRACPFTAGKNFFNVGETHDVAFAADNFGSVRKIPKYFDGWEELARRIECNYVRGWVAMDGSRMFLWDDFDEVLTKKSGHFEYFQNALIRLKRKGYTVANTELWDRGGERYIGKLHELLLVDWAAPPS